MMGTKHARNDATLLSPRSLHARGEETASRSAFQRKSHAVGEGQPLAPALSPRARSKYPPLTPTLSPSQRGEGERGLVPLAVCQVLEVRRG